MKKLFGESQAVCPVCKNKMILDDLDHAFEGCQDEYYLCMDERCESSLRVKVRYNKIVKKEYRYNGK